MDEDSVEVAYDAAGEPPIIRFEDTDQGALMLANGDIVATFAGQTALDMASVPIILTGV